MNHGPELQHHCDQRDTLEVDVVIVGAGPAGLAAAYHMRKLLVAKGRAETSIVVIEKGREVGAHSISGAVLDPRGIAELMPDWKAKGVPIEGTVEEDHLFYLTRNWALDFPFLPPPMRNRGFSVISLSRFVRWLGQATEASGVDVFCGFSASELLIEDGRVVGVRTGDKGVDRKGVRKENYEPGIDVRAKLTLLAEGARGSLTKELVNRLKLDSGRNPQVYSVGVKEVWEVPEQESHRGRIIHTLGFPLSAQEFGGGFLYNMNGNRVAVGLVLGLDYHDPRLDPHGLFQRFKQHPMVSGILRGGQLVSYGAKAIPEGGYWAMPRQYFNGGMIIGDGGGFLNPLRLKGIHLAMKSGMLAAETAVEAIEREEFSENATQRFKELVEQSWIQDELWRARNFHQAFQKGLWIGMIHAGLQMLTGGRGVWNRYGSEAGHRRMKQLSELTEEHQPVEFDGELTFDKLTDVYHSGTVHEENQPTHLVVTEPQLCGTRCAEEYGNPCQYFCPADVYRMEKEPTGGLRLAITASNCVHCKTCDIMDPYQVIDWIPPEGGGGPGYECL